MSTQCVLSKYLKQNWRVPHQSSYNEPCFKGSFTLHEREGDFSNKSAVGKFDSSNDRFAWESVKRQNKIHLFVYGIENREIRWRLWCVIKRGPFLYTMQRNTTCLMLPTCCKPVFQIRIHFQEIFPNPVEVATFYNKNKIVDTGLWNQMTRDLILWRLTLRQECCVQYILAYFTTKQTT